MTRLGIVLSLLSLAKPIPASRIKSCIECPPSSRTSGPKSAKRIAEDVEPSHPPRTTKLPKPSGIVTQSHNGRDILGALLDQRGDWPRHSVHNLTTRSAALGRSRTSSTPCPAYSAMSVIVPRRSRSGEKAL